MTKALRNTGIVLLALAAAGAAALLVVRVETRRHRRNLFSRRPHHRLAALGHMAGRSASVDDILLLRDFIAWEPRRLLRNRARSILSRMEREAREEGTSEGRNGREREPG